MLDHTELYRQVFGHSLGKTPSCSSMSVPLMANKNTEDQKLKPQTLASSLLQHETHFMSVRK